ncbi:MAG: hypothetical protein MZV64_49815 [Ignavibacteriales bacterium]|nr:hypothetical protein [Ignavibacteriales bacterium]
MDVLAQGEGQLGGRVLEIRRLDDVAELDDLALVVGDLDAQRGLAGDALDADRLRLQGQGQVLGPALDLRDLDARGREVLVGRDDRAGVVLADLALDAELLELLLDAPLLVEELGLADLLGRKSDLEQVEVRVEVIALPAGIGEEQRLGLRRGDRLAGERDCRDGLAGRFLGQPALFPLALPLGLLLGFAGGLFGLGIGGGGRGRVLVADLLPHPVLLLGLLAVRHLDPDFFGRRFEGSLGEAEGLGERPAGGEEEKGGQRGQKENERADGAEEADQAVEQQLAEQAAGRHGAAADREGLEDEGQQRADDHQADRDRAQALEQVGRRAAQDGPQGGVAEDERQEVGGQAQEPEITLGEIGADAAGEVADRVPGRRRSGEGRVLGIEADDADDGEESKEDEQNAGDLDGQGLLFLRGLAVPAVLRVPAVPGGLLPLFHGGIIAHSRRSPPLAPTMFFLASSILARKAWGSLRNWARVSGENPKMAQGARPATRGINASAAFPRPRMTAVPLEQTRCARNVLPIGMRGITWRIGIEWWVTFW